MTLEERLADIGKDRQRVEVERHAVSLKLRMLVIEAVEEGWTKTKIADAASLSRQTVHEILRNR
jgi:DNA-binding NarL/FixJ family response regulator